MSQTDRQRWDERYRADAYADRTHPTRLVEAHAGSLPRGRALDVACGAGRNAVHLATLGFEVDAVDISAVAIERGRTSAAAAGVTVNFAAADLERGLPVGLASDYALIIVVRYVNLPLVRTLAERIRPGGFLIIEEHLVSSRNVAGPRGADHRVRNGEIAEALAGLSLRFYREGIVSDPDGRQVALAQAIATCDGSVEIEYC